MSNRPRASSFSVASPVLVACASFLVSCGAQQHAPASAPGSKSTEAAPVIDEWKAATWEERHDVMTFTVLPNMARLFQRFRGEASPTMTCATCHGRDGEEVAYKMPRGLPPLDPKHMPDPDSPDPKEARITRFMIEEVTPTMADLMGRPRMDPKTHRGFSCFACHARLKSTDQAKTEGATVKP